MADSAREENFEVPQPPSPQLESKPEELEPSLTQSLLDEPVEPALDQASSADDEYTVEVPRPPEPELSEVEAEISLEIRPTTPQLD